MQKSEDKYERLDLRRLYLVKERPEGREEGESERRKRSGGRKEFKDEKMMVKEEEEEGEEEDDDEEEEGRVREGQTKQKEKESWVIGILWESIWTVGVKTTI